MTHRCFVISFMFSLSFTHPVFAAEDDHWDDKFAGPGAEGIGSGSYAVDSSTNLSQWAEIYTGDVNNTNVMDAAVHESVALEGTASSVPMQGRSRRARFRVAIDKAMPDSVGGKCSVISLAVPGADQAAPSPSGPVEESAMSFSSPPGCDGTMRGGIEEGIDEAMPSNSKHGFMVPMHGQKTVEAAQSDQRYYRVHLP